MLPVFRFVVTCSNCMGFEYSVFIVEQYLGRALWVGGSVGGFFR